MQNALVLDALHDRRQLTGYCSRILGSTWDADDAVQETMVRAWTRQDSFEGRSSARSWVYRIATNVCLDMLRSQKRRAVPMDFDGLEVLPHDQDLQAGEGDPADAVAAREAAQLAFAVALEALPSRQRAILILRDVLCWSAPEVAELLGTTTASVNSALQRARATLTGRTSALPSRHADAGQRALIVRYATALEDRDMAALLALIRQDAKGTSGTPAPLGGGGAG